MPLIGTDSGAEAECPAGGGGPVIDHSGGPCPRRTSTETGNEYGGMADGAAVHGKQDGTGYVGMVRCPLPEIWPRSPDLPRYCNGCNATFSIFHALDCKWGGLVTACHKDLRDGVKDLAGKAFNSSHLRDYPLIFAGCVVKRSKANPSRTKGTSVPDTTLSLEAMEQKGDMEFPKKGEEQ